MKTLYIECNMGAAGDMLMAALSELLPEPETFVERINGLGIEDVCVTRAPAVKCGITGTRVEVKMGEVEEESVDVVRGHEHSHHGGHHHEHTHHHHHSHIGMDGIKQIIDKLALPEKVKEDALAVYGLIAEAESKAHGKPVSAVHFHEVGMMDAVVDIVGVCMLMYELAPQQIVVSPIHVGSGQVRCAHGVLPVPAPATAHILQGVPTYGGQIQGELCTPTGAALLKYFADEFGAQPVMAVSGTGYGMGKKDFPAANCIRAFIGETKAEQPGIVEIRCNLDDMTGEQLGYALEVLLAKGALDAYIVPIQMKKSRPGHMLICLCRPNDEEAMVGLIIRHTTTLGVRCSDWRRYTMEREIETVRTAYGPVRIKKASGFGVNKSKPEYEDVAGIAAEHHLSIAESLRIIENS